MAIIRDRYQLDVDVGGALNSFASLRTAVGGFVGVLAVGQVVEFGRAIIDNARKYETYNNQLRLITATQAEASETLERLSTAARNNRADLGAFVELYSKLSLATESFGASQESVLTVTQKFSQALALSGADANTSAAAIRQFGQAMASGVVRGDEFVSITEALGPALNIMARESGVSVGKLRELSQAGELTADVFFEMVEGSNALTAAFNSMTTTTDQLESRLAQTISAATNEVDEFLGVSERYRNIVRDLDREIGNLFNVNPLENIAPSDIVEQARNGLLSIDDALFELQSRLGEFVGLMNPFTGNLIFEADQQRLDNLREQVRVLRELQEEMRVLNEESQAQVQADREAAAARNQALAPLQSLIDRTEDYVDANLRGRTALQRLQADQAQVNEDLERLVSLRGTEIEQYLDLDSLIATAVLRNDQIAASIAKINERTEDKRENFQTYYDALIESSARAAREVEYNTLAIARLNEDLGNRRISVDTYAAAMERLNEVMGNNDAARERTRILEEQARVLENATERTDNFLRTLREGTEDAEFGLQSLTLDPLEQQVMKITRDLRRNLNAEIRRLNQALAEGADATQIQTQIQTITTATEEAIRQQTAIAEQAYEAQRSFEYGWARAFENYEENATNAAENASKIFNTLTRGMEDTIVNFAKTGKFEFKDLLATIAEEILRSNVRRLIAQTFGGFGAGGGAVNNPFAGFFANGGTIPAGKFGVVGEAGPELVTGPATVTPLNGAGAGTVNYYINAVDAPSFRSLVASDPGFIHAVAQQGARTVPGRRR